MWPGEVCRLEQSMKRPNQRRVAFHEAGHAVALHRFGFECSEAAVYPHAPRDGVLGHAKPAGGFEDEESARRYVIMLCCGYAAEAYAAPTCRDDAYEWAQLDFDDVAEINGLLEGPRPLERWIALADVFVRSGH